MGTTNCTVVNTNINILVDKAVAKGRADEELNVGHTSSSLPFPTNESHTKAQVVPEKKAHSTSDGH